MVSFSWLCLLGRRDRVIPIKGGIKNREVISHDFLYFCLFI
jgi:hypothetical protein